MRVCGGLRVLDVQLVPEAVAGLRVQGVFEAAVSLDQSRLRSVEIGALDVAFVPRGRRSQRSQQLAGLFAARELRTALVKQILVGRVLIGAFHLAKVDERLRISPLRGFLQDAVLASSKVFGLLPEEQSVGILAEEGPTILNKFRAGLLEGRALIGRQTGARETRILRVPEYCVPLGLVVQ